MAGKQAKVLSDQAVKDFLFFAETTRYPERNRVVVLLSVKAGLRAGEIANLTWDMIETPSGEVGTSIELRDQAAKMGHGRRIPIHADLRTALIAWRQKCEPNGVGHHEANKKDPNNANAQAPSDRK